MTTTSMSLRSKGKGKRHKDTDKDNGRRRKRREGYPCQRGRSQNSRGFAPVQISPLAIVRDKMSDGDDVLRLAKVMLGELANA